MPPGKTASPKKRVASPAAKKSTAMKAAPVASPAKQLDSFLDKFTPDIAAEARVALRRMRARLPGAQELVYDNYNALAIGFSPTERTSEALFSIAVFPRWVSLFFLQNGTCLRDPDCFLEGTGNQARHIKLDNGAMIDDPGVQDLIAQALELAAPAHRPRPVPPPHHQIDLAETAPPPPCWKIAAIGPGLYFRSLFRITSFSPDQTASTAQTFTSTNPIGKLTSRTPSSVMSVDTPEAFFGHDTHTTPSCASTPRRKFRCSASSCFFVTKRWAMSSPAAGAFRNFGSGAPCAISSATLFGIFRRHVT